MGIGKNFTTRYVSQYMVHDTMQCITKVNTAIYFAVSVLEHSPDGNSNNVLCSIVASSQYSPMTLIQKDGIDWDVNEVLIPPTFFNSIRLICPVVPV